MRKTYVWTLDVVLPEDHQPHDDEFGSAWYRESVHHWPRNRKFLSEKGAQDRANMFRQHGAEVTVIRSDPVTFPSVTSTRQQIIEKMINGLMAIAEDLS